MEFRAIVSPTIADLFRDQIQDMIFKGDLKPGDQLPTERELAERMKISKSVVHNGIRELERDGFLKIIPRHGVYVADYAENGNINTLMALLKYHGGVLDARTTRSMVEVRACIGVLAMHLVGRRRTDADIQKMKDDLAAFEQAAAGEDDTEILRCFYQFHHDIGILSRNNIIPMLLNSFRDISGNLWKDWLSHFGTEETIRCMKAYIEYIEQGDGDKAGQLFSEECERFMQELL